MEFKTEEIFQLTGTIWESMLSLPLEPESGSGETPGASAARSTAACVQITGAWNGAVLLDCPAELARRAASILLGVEQAAVTVYDLQDAVAELVNMIGGNIKGLLPPTCFLSLPAVVEGGDYSTRIPGSRLVRRIGFTCLGQGLSINILEKIRNQSAAA